MKERVQTIPETTYELTSEKVVGESYYTYDSLNTYYPTVTFLFQVMAISRAYGR